MHYFVFGSYKGFGLGEVRSIMNRVLAQGGGYIGLSKLARDFWNCHYHRNRFNIRMDRVTSLTKQDDVRYQDNNGHIWKKQDWKKNVFHKPIISLSDYSLKFLRDDSSLLQGEFELIVRHNSIYAKNDHLIDGVGDFDGQYLSTYNFGRTRNFQEHKTLDVTPHFLSDKYFPYVLGEKCEIIEN